MIVAVAVGIALALRAWLGPTTIGRLYHQDEVLRFRPSAGHGLGQLAGEALLVMGCAWAARRWLRVKL